MLCRSALLRGVSLLGQTQRSIALSPVANIKQINVKEEGNRIVIEAEYKASPRENYLVPSAKPSITGAPCPCPLCRLGLFIQHTDVLILRQFVDSKGKQIPSDVTGLCKLQHRRMDYLLVMAEKAGLMEKIGEDGTPKALVGWEAFNKYYDENAIEEFVFYKTRRNRA